MNATQEGEKSFETLLAEVEQIVRTLQEGGVPLEKALALYEQGFNLLKDAQARLAAARQKLEILRKETGLEQE